MHAICLPFEAIAWVHLLHRNADLLLLASIATLGLLPLVSIYLIETEKMEAVATMEVSSYTRTFLRSLIYLAIIFPYLLALLSTYISVQLIRHPGFQQEEPDVPRATLAKVKAASFWKLYRNTKILQEEDLQQDDYSNHTCKIPSGETTRLVPGDCVICMHEYQVGDKVVWSSNPKCIHCYHSGCIKAWMEPWDDKSKRCPCCRQSFFR